MTAVIPKWNNEKFKGYDILQETEHYAVVQNAQADVFTKESDYLLVLKERGTIESRGGAYSITVVNMRDAEELLQAIIRNSASPAPNHQSNKDLN